MPALVCILECKAYLSIFEKFKKSVYAFCNMVKNVPIKAYAH